MKRFSEFRLYEFEEKKKMSNPEQMSFMDNLYQRVKKEIMPKISNHFRADYDRGREIIIHTGNNKDLSASAKIVDDKMVITTKPVNEPAFEMNFNFESANPSNIISILLDEFEKSETNGLFAGKTPRFMPSYQDVEDDEYDENDNSPNEEQDDVDIPLTHKPKRIKRSIDIKIIKNVLEDAFILEDIDLKNVTIEELIRRMLLESRKK